MPGPASTQLAIFCAWRLRGRAGALVGGAAFIAPGLVAILALAVLFVSTSPPLWVLGAGAGGGAAVPAVAVQAGLVAARPEGPEAPSRAREPGKTGEGHDHRGAGPGSPRPNWSCPRPVTR
jgi:chromate transporter